MNKYDIIFISREALMGRSVFFEKKFAGSNAKVIFDFDDAIWLPLVPDGNKKLAFLKNTAKTETIIRLADLVFAGNRYLADYAAQFNKHIAIIPTTIDPNLYIPQKKEKKDSTICIGWSGSFSTIQHFLMAIPALKKIKQRFGPGVQFKIIGDPNYYCIELETQGVAWKAASEIEDLSEIDIGIMPLPDDEWSKGKCGLKGLQYMALEIPALMSPVGVNTEIIQYGINGYLPGKEDEWVEILSILIVDKQKRTTIGKAGRQTVIYKYSVEAVKQQYLDNFDRLTASK